MKVASYTQRTSPALQLAMVAGAMGFFLASPAISSVVDAQGPPKPRPDPSGLPIEHSLFELTFEPVTDDTPGGLKYGGYSWRDVLVTKRYYGARGREIGGAQVEIVHHPDQYPYVLHDFFATFRTIASGGKRPPRSNVVTIDGRVDEGQGHWQFTAWTLNGSETQHTICTCIRPRKDRTANEGLVGWYARHKDRLTTVLIRFSNLDGAPEMLINEFLEKYASSVAESDFHGETWVSDDVQKWVELAKLQKSDRTMFTHALLRLRAYDDNFFGVDPTRFDPDDPAQLDAALKDLKEHAERWLVARDAKKDQEKDN